MVTNPQKEKLYKEIIKFAKQEHYDKVYDAIGQLLLCKAEYPKLVRFLVDIYFETDFWDRNLQSNSSIICALLDLDSIPKRRILFNEDFQYTFSKLVFLITTQKHNYHDITKYKYDKLLAGPRLERKLENVLVCKEAFNECRLVTHLFRNKMTSDTSILFDILYYYMRRYEKTKSVHLVAYIYQWKEQTYDRVPVSNLFFEDLKEECLADIAWFLWWFLLEYCNLMTVKEPADSKHAYKLQLVRDTFTLYKYNYMKKHRDARIHIFQTLVMIILSKHAHDNKKLEYNDDILENIKISIFGSAAEHVNVEKHNNLKVNDNNTSPKTRPPKGNATTHLSRADVPDQEASIVPDSKSDTRKKKDTSYLHCIIYNDNAQDDNKDYDKDYNKDCDYSAASSPSSLSAINANPEKMDAA